ncbi:MAG: sel1 repeat family protein [Campylobacteraceae bacterium]|jgi:TPR repeat protein|nr:sel1 repeat family protein [Campylobacteraceae bacterium]
MKAVLKWLIGGALFGNLVLAGDFDEAKKIYANGDYDKTAKIYKKACDKEHTKGCVKLGHMYFFGRGVEKDNIKAFKLFEKACNDGRVTGCHSLAHMYYNGIGGVERNNIKAFELLEKTYRWMSY